MGLRATGIMLSLLVVPLTLGYLAPYEYGIWITLNSILTWINYFDIGLGNGLRNKLAEAIAKNDLRLGKVYVSTTFALLSVIVAILCGLFFVVNEYINWDTVLNVTEEISGLNTIVIILFVSLSISFVMRTVGNIYMAYQRTWISSLFTVLGSALSLVWIIYLRYFEPPSLLKVAVAFSLSPIIIYCIAYPVTFYIQYREIKPSIRHIQMRHAKSLGGLGIKFFVLQMSCLLIFATSNVLISNIFSPAEVTPYSIAHRLFNVPAIAFSILTSPLWSAITDAYARKELQWIEKNISKMLKIWLLCSAGLCLMVLISPIIYKIWIGDSVKISTSLSISMAVYNIIFLFTTLFSAYCNGVGHLRAAIISMCSAAVLFYPCCYIFTLYLGVSGVAYAMGFVLLIPAITQYLTYKNDMKCLASNN